MHHITAATKKTDIVEKRETIILILALDGCQKKIVSKAASAASVNARHLP
jgi:uncharacterized metal-binding protein